MSQVRAGKLEADEAEPDRERAEAVRRVEEKVGTEPQARSATYERENNRLVVELTNDTVFIVPCDLVQGLRGVDPALIAEVELLPRGAALHWEQLGLTISLAGLIACIFGGESWMSSIARELGRRGGSARSEAKAAAVRANGRRGGRPSTKVKGTEIG